MHLQRLKAERGAGLTPAVARPAAAEVAEQAGGGGLGVAQVDNLVQVVDQHLVPAGGQGWQRRGAAVRRHRQLAGGHELSGHWCTGSCQLLLPCWHGCARSAARHSTAAGGKLQQRPPGKPREFAAAVGAVLKHGELNVRRQQIWNNSVPGRVAQGTKVVHRAYRGNVLDERFFCGCKRIGWRGKAT